MTAHNALTLAHFVVSVNVPIFSRQIKKRPQQGWASLRALFYPLTHPWGKRNDLENIADIRWLKGKIVCNA